MALTALAGAILVALVVLGARAPLARRLGLRNARRRPREAMLVMLGCVLGTALIVASSTVGTSFSVSLRDQALAQVGPVDARIQYETREEWAGATRLFAARPNDAFDVVVAVATLEMPVSDAALRHAVPRAKLVEADYPRAGVLNASGSTPLGAGPTSGTVWINRRVASAAKVTVGQTVTIHSAKATSLRVTRITDSALVSFQDDPTETGENMLVSPGTIDRLRSEDPSALPPRWSTLVVGNGPAEGSAALNRRLSEAVAPFNGRVAIVREARLEAAKSMGAAVGLFLTTIGGFGILAGLMLLVNVLFMLAQERQTELGTMRAVGMPRPALTGSFSIESALYSLIGALLGGAAGLGLGKFLVMVVARIAETPDPTMNVGLQIRFAADSRTVATGIAAGFVASTLVAFATSYRVSRMEVIRALRNLPRAPRSPWRAATPLLLAGVAVGPLLSLGGYHGEDTLLFLFGMTIAFACIGALVAQRRGLDAGLTIACGANVVWGIAVQLYTRQPHPPPEAALVVGVVVVASGTLFVNAQQVRMARVLRRFGTGRLVLTTRLGLANPMRNRVRMLLTVGPFALVTFTVVYAEGLAHMISTEIDRIGPRLNGDYEVFATSNASRPFAFTAQDASGADLVVPASTTFAGFTTAEVTSPRVWPLTAVTPAITSADPPPLVARAEGYATDREVYRALAENADFVIVPLNFLLDESTKVVQAALHETWVGDVVTIYDPVTARAQEARVVGVSMTDVLGTGAFYGAPAARELFGDRLRENSAFISTPSDPAGLAANLHREGVRSGVRAVSVEAAAKRYFAFVDDTVTLYRADLGVGIVVGIAGIAVVLVRSVRDRRQQIGVLRAMGFDRNQVGRSFLFEGAFTALQGLAVGVGLGVAITTAMTRSATARDLFGYEPAITMPAPGVAWLAVGLLAAALLASIGPARLASRIPPAIALRLVD